VLREVRYNKPQITVSVGFLVRYTHLTDKCMLVLSTSRNRFTPVDSVLCPVLHWESNLSSSGECVLVTVMPIVF